MQVLSSNEETHARFENEKLDTIHLLIEDNGAGMSAPSWLYFVFAFFATVGLTRSYFVKNCENIPCHIGIVSLAAGFAVATVVSFPPTFADWVQGLYQELLILMFSLFVTSFLSWVYLSIAKWAEKNLYKDLPF